METPEQKAIRGRYAAATDGRSQISCQNPCQPLIFYFHQKSFFSFLS